MGVNKALILGKLAEDPDAKYTANGALVCSFAVLTSEPTGKDGQEQVETHRIIAWDKVAESCSKYLRKDRLVHIEGMVRTRSWDDRESGKKHYITEIHAQKVQFLGGGEKAPDRKNDLNGIF
jgi:single-strand DNA-binding protein